MAGEFGTQVLRSGVFVSEAIEVTQWDRFLGRLGLTEHEALDAINREGDVGCSIRRFVQDSCRDHFIPENVLLAVNLRRDEAEARLILARWRDPESGVN